MKIKTQLIYSHLAVAMIPLIAVGIVISIVVSNSYHSMSKSAQEEGVDVMAKQGEEALQKSTFEKLEAIRAIKKKQIQDYFAERRGDMKVLVDLVETLRKKQFSKFRRYSTSQR